MASESIDLNIRKTAGFKILMNHILEEIQDDSVFDGLWKSIEAFENS